jgi:C-terminal processing protease CtpA/Prc/beta-lactamase regulating signal transducer with metallopeptidase domain
MIDMTLALGSFAEHAWAIGVDIALKATLLLVAASLLDRVLRTRHLLACSSIWNACLIGLILLPVAAIAFPRLRIECLPPETATAESIDMWMTDPTAMLPIDHIEESPTTGATATGPAVRSLEPQTPSPPARIASPPPFDATSLPQVDSRPVPWRSWLLGTYALGVALLLARLAASLYAVRRLRRMSPPLTDPEWTAPLRCWCRRLNVVRPVQLAMCDQFDTPVVIGWRRPTILVPTAMVSTLTTEQRDAILVHELAHIQRVDYPWQLLLAVLQTAYWFHPLAWLAGRSIRSVRERACDDYCIHWLGDGGKYGTALLDLAARMVRSRGLALGLAAVRPSTIEQRVAHIDRSTGVSQCVSRRRSRTLLAVIAAVLAIVVGSIDLCRIEASADEPEVTIQAADEKEDPERNKTAGETLAEARNLLATLAETGETDEWRDRGERTYVVSFKGINQFSPRTPKELLDGFMERHRDGARTHHFRTEEKDGVLIGHICVDGEVGRDSLMTLLRESDRVALVKCTRPWSPGQEKSVATACQLLTEITQNHAEELSPAELGHAYAYLGYVEDRGGNRAAAIRWFEKVIPVEGPRTEGIRRTAEAGLTRPIMMLRHLERLAASRKTTPTPTRMRILERIGDAVVSRDMPSNLSLKTYLTEAERLENFELLWQAIDHWFSFFDHKNIDWPEVKERYRSKVQATETSADYYQVLYQLVRELKDPHSWLCNYKDENGLPRFSPAVAVRRIEGKAVVTQVVEQSEAAELGMRPGSTITHVDGLPVDEKVEQLRPRLRVSSSERNFLEANFRRILHGEEGTTVAISFLPSGSDTPQHIELARDAHAVRDVREPDFPVNKEHYVWSGIHPSGCGYIRITSFSGRIDLADEFDRALENLKGTRALMIDIRENPGGYGTAHSRIVGRFLSENVTAGATYVRSGPGHRDFDRRDRRLAPAGEWQYTGPVALLTNPITGSASDLFARDLVGTGRPITVGTTTHGNSTGTCVYVTLPCNLVVRVSRGYTCGLNGRIIEGNGNVPAIQAHLTVDDILHGTDSVITRAAKALK